MFPDYLLLINLFYLRVNHGFGHVYRPASGPERQVFKGEIERGWEGRVFAYLAQPISFGSLEKHSGWQIKSWTPCHLD